MRSDKLDLIALGFLSAADARSIIQARLTEPVEKQVAENIYAVLRAWVWKALNERKRGEADVREWFQMLRGYDAYFRKTFPNVALKIQVLWELMYESIGAGDMFDADDMPPHVIELLDHVNAAGQIEEDRLLEIMPGLKQENLHRALSRLAIHGFVERRNMAETVTVMATAAGREFRHAVKSHES